MKQYTEKDFEELQIKDDFMFGIVMREPLFCKQFLERVLGVKISRINYPDYQKTIDLKADAKGIRLDIYVWDEEGNIYDIDMQASEKKNIPKRIRYYQGMVDLNILKKGEDYKKLKRSFIIFVCTFDVFKEGRHIYTFENRCLQNPGLVLGDDTVKIILNTKGTMDDVTPELKRLLDYIDNNEPEDEYTRELEKEVESVKKNEKWRLNYMTLQMRYQEIYEEGKEEGRKEAVSEYILDLLSDLGSVSDDLKAKIKSEDNELTLKAMFRLAARSESIEMFLSGLRRLIT